MNWHTFNYDWIVTEKKLLNENKNYLKQNFKIKIMKHSTKTLLPALSISDLKNLTILVEERLDVSIPETGKKKFSQADLWNINKHRRTFQTRRYLK